jgi:hypothetical protein
MCRSLRSARRLYESVSDTRDPIVRAPASRSDPFPVADLTEHLAPTLVAQEAPAKITVHITRIGEKWQP